mmetsp:Transcript_5608/g.18493  ORF Transcript_5608/g.18493 Transcript_5608/m.18493 type:complete len:238 (-) Transcript_5608:184-897(-)
MMSCNPSGFDVLPFPVNPKFRGNASLDFNIIATWLGDGVHVVAQDPDAGPVPPPSNVVSPLATASVAICGQMKWMCVSMPPAVSMRPSPAMASVFTPTTNPGVTFRIASGFPALPIPTMIPCLIPTSALKIPVWSIISAFVMTVSRVSTDPTPHCCPIPSLSVFPPPNLHSSPYSVKSCSTATYKFVSPRRTLSPTVGPYMLVYFCREIVTGGSPGGGLGPGWCKNPPAAIRSMMSW